MKRSTELAKDRSEPFDETLFPALLERHAARLSAWPAEFLGR